MINKSHSLMYYYMYIITSEQYHHMFHSYCTYKTPKQMYVNHHFKQNTIMAMHKYIHSAVPN